MPKHDDIIDQAAKRFKLAAEYDRDERQLADDDIRFATNDDGYQWPDQLRKEREEDDRPVIVNNKIPEKIDQVDGEFKQLRPSFKVRAIDNISDPKLAEITAGIMRHIEYNSDAKTAYQHAHTSTLYSGRGAWRIDIVDSEEDPFVRDIQINRIPNVLTVYWDPFAKKADRSDANYFFVSELIPKEDFKKDHEDIYESWPSEDIWDDWRSGDSYRVAEYWWKEKSTEKHYRVTRMVNGIPTEMTVKEMLFNDQPVMDEDGKPKEKTSNTYKVRWCKLVAKKIIEGPHEWATPDIPIILELGKEINIRGKAKTRGMPRYAKDPQRMYNYWSATTTEQVMLAPKAPYLVTAEMIADFQDMWDTSFKKNYAYLPYKADPNAPGATPRREPPPMMSSAYQHEFMRLEHDIMSAMGIYQASLGDQGNEASGRAILARQRQGNIGSYPYTDAFNTAYTYSCKQLIRLIPTVYDTERIVRIIGEDGQDDQVPINARPNIPEAQQLPEKLVAPPKDGITQYLNDISVGKYDVAVTIGPSYTTQREETFAILMDMVKTAPQLSQAIMDLIASNLDIPKHSEELVKRLRKLVPIGIRDLEPGEQPPPQPPPDPKIMLEMAKLQLEKEKTDREQERKEFEARMKATADLVTAESKELGEQVKQMMAAVDQYHRFLDMQWKQASGAAQMQHGMETKNREMELKQMQMEQAQQGQMESEPEETELT